MSKPFLLATLSVVGLLAGLTTGDPLEPPAPVSPATVTASADAVVKADRPTATGGSSTRLRTDGDPLARSVLRFTLPLQQGPVARATLRLQALHGNTRGITVMTVTGAWKETTVSWNTSPALGQSVQAVPSRPGASRST